MMAPVPVPARGLRALVACGAAVAASLPLFAACIASGCTSSGTLSPPTEAGSEFVTVVTSGGGVPEGAATGDPFASSSSSGGPAPVAESGGSSGGEAGGSSSGDDGGGAEGGDGSPGVAYTPPTCDGTNPCDLRSNTCCLQSSMTGLSGTCIAGASSSCCPDGGSCNQATVHCLQALECGGGMSCCGDILFLLGQVVSSCAAIPDGGTCPAIPWSLSEIGVQLCKTDAECINGQPCTHQMCVYGAVLDMCGLQSDNPLNCTPL
jgi:hypothetical protein